MIAEPRPAMYIHVLDLAESRTPKGFGLRESMSPSFYQSFPDGCNFHQGAASLVGRLSAANLSNEEM
jgi:hypothetical protein